MPRLKQPPLGRLDRLVGVVPSPDRAGDCTDIGERDLGSLDALSASRRIRYRERRREEARWRSLNGPVEVRHV